MTLFKRLKNLWRLSEYAIGSSPELLDKRFKTLTKDFTTIKKIPAKIILDPPDYFKEEPIYHD